MYSVQYKVIEKEDKENKKTKKKKKEKEKHDKQKYHLCKIWYWTTGIRFYVALHHSSGPFRAPYSAFEYYLEHNYSIYIFYKNIKLKK